jgi:endogenous inhibitor of DNA gyrase (YacG/DUF329 family)
MEYLYKIKFCIICKKPVDNTFYDSSIYRPLCSRNCYSMILSRSSASAGGRLGACRLARKAMT